MAEKSKSGGDECDDNDRQKQVRSRWQKTARLATNKPEDGGECDVIDELCRQKQARSRWQNTARLATNTPDHGGGGGGHRTTYGRDDYLQELRRQKTARNVTKSFQTLVKQEQSRRLLLNLSQGGGCNLDLSSSTVGDAADHAQAQVSPYQTSPRKSKTFKREKSQRPSLVSINELPNEELTSLSAVGNFLEDGDDSLTHLDLDPQLHSRESMDEYQQGKAAQQKHISTLASEILSALDKFDLDDDEDHDGHGHGGGHGGHDHHHHHSHSIPFYAAPVQRQMWGDDQILPHINWGDLFFDLFYVAAAYNLGSLLISSLSPDLWHRGVVYFIGVFGPLYNMWESKLVYEARYSAFDYAHRIVEIFRVFCLSFAVLHIKPLELMSDPSSAEMFCFALALFVESLVHIALKVELVWFGQGDVAAIRNHSKRKLATSYVPLSILYLVATVIAAVEFFGTKDDDKDDYDKDKHMRRLAGGAADLPADATEKWSTNDIPITICAFAYVFNVAFTFIRKTFLFKKFDDFRNHNVPSNIDFCIHRYGEWIMLMLGEAVLSLLIVDTTEDRDYYLVAIIGVMTVIFVQALKFESEPSSADKHALWRSITAGQKYSILVQLLSIGFIALGVSYKVMLKNIHALSLMEDEYYEKEEYGGDSRYGDEPYGDGYDEQPHQRRLAGGGGVVSTDKASAALFCASLVLAMASTELMGYNHKGRHKMYRRFQYVDTIDDRVRWHKNLVAIEVVKFALLAVVATLPMYLTDSVGITAVGFVLVGCFCAMRILSWSLWHKEHSSETIDIVDMSFRYPNKDKEKRGIYDSTRKGENGEEKREGVEHAMTLASEAISVIPLGSRHTRVKNQMADDSKETEDDFAENV